MTLDQLREYAKAAGHAAGSEVHKFIDWIEGNTAAPELTVAELQAQQAPVQVEAPADDAPPDAQEPAP